MSDEVREPKWRGDFPIRWGADNYVTRREFTKFLVAVSGATALGNGYFALDRFRKRDRKFPVTEVMAVGEIPVGGVKLFRYPTPDDQAMLIRLGEEEYVAYSQKCTHLSCPVHFSAKTGQIECPCHHGSFEARTGKVLAGPPPRPLPNIRLRITDDKVYAEEVIGS